jgi:hypothetical protein
VREKNYSLWLSYTITFTLWNWYEPKLCELFGMICLESSLSKLLYRSFIKLIILLVYFSLIKEWIVHWKLVSTVTCLFIVMPDSTWLHLDVWLVYFLCLLSRCVQVFVILKLLIVVVNHSYVVMFVILLSVIDYKSWLVLNKIFVIGSKSRELRRYFVGLCWCELS